MIRKAFIPAAGMGTRLGKATGDRPKALVKVNGVPMLELVIERLKGKGINHFMVNVHHFSRQLIDFLSRIKYSGVQIEISDETNELLDTGGAIKKAIRFFEGNEPVLVHNADIISEVDLSELEMFHKENRALATLCVRKRKSGRVLLFDEEMNLTGWKNTVDESYKWVSDPADSYLDFAYSGIYLADRRFARLLPMTGKFSIIDALLKMAGTHRILGYLDRSQYWFDLGTEEKIKIAESYLRDQMSFD